MAAQTAPGRTYGRLTIACQNSFAMRTRSNGTDRVVSSWGMLVVVVYLAPT